MLYEVITSCCVSDIYRFAAIDSRFITNVENRDLRRTAFLRFRKTPEYCPVLTRIMHRTHVTPGQRYAIAPINSFQFPWSISIEIV